MRVHWSRERIRLERVTITTGARARPLQVSRQDALLPSPAARGGGGVLRHARRRARRRRARRRARAARARGVCGGARSSARVQRERQQKEACERLPCVQLPSYLLSAVQRGAWASM